MLGGPSAEREVSLRSGKAAAQALKSLGHEVFELDPSDGHWSLPAGTDVVFLALHGSYGEDGTVQRRLEEMGTPYTGCGPEASRIAFDKVLTKRLCLAAGVPTARFAVFEDPSSPWPMGWAPPVVLKPVRQGSSVGLCFVNRVDEWAEALREVLKHDTEALMEEHDVNRFGLHRGPSLLDYRIPTSVDTPALHALIVGDRLYCPQPPSGCRLCWGTGRRGFQPRRASSSGQP